jgi:hypothetical protein
MVALTPLWDRDMEVGGGATGAPIRNRDRGTRSTTTVTTTSRRSTTRPPTNHSMVRAAGMAQVVGAVMSVAVEVAVVDLLLRHTTVMMQGVQALRHSGRRNHPLARVRIMKP